MRVREPRSTALVFRTGKMVVTGTKTLNESELAAKKYLSIIQKAGYNSASFNEFKIQNMTATCSCGFPISLEGLLYGYSQFSTYEPELFPGLVYRMIEPKIVFLVFVSGKVVITGAKNVEALELGFNNIYPQLLEVFYS